MGALMIRDGGSEPVREEDFAKEVQRLRAEYGKALKNSRLCPPAGLSVKEFNMDVIRDIEYHVFRYEDGTSRGQCIRIADLPGTLSGDILRLRQELPTLTGDHEIVGNGVNPLKGPVARMPRRRSQGDSDDITTVLSHLPVVEVDYGKHFLKRAKHESEIVNLLQCQGGSCPGTPISPHIVQLLGRSSDGQLVFERFLPGNAMKAFDSIVCYKRWILQLISGLKCLHSRGIVHRDLCLNSLLISPDGSRLLICDIGGRRGNDDAPEILPQLVLDSDFTEKTDIYDIGNVIKCMVYGDSPVTKVVEWKVPRPLQEIVEACQRESPAGRPTLNWLQEMVEDIEVAPP